MKFDNHFLDALTEKAKASPRPDYGCIMTFGTRPVEFKNGKYDPVTTEIFLNKE